ncbi:MAG TPA: glutaredoxin 3 [Gammaproteobacteria bacterium]|nr:glutaredoxin 3 [Gammaproteobacteria bacterium]
MSAPSITVYTSAFCPYCNWAKKLLDAKNASYEEIRIDQDHDQARIMVERAGRTSVPQIFIGDYHVGGYDDLAAMDRAGELDPMLRRQAS